MNLGTEDLKTEFESKFRIKKIYTESWWVL